MATTDVTTTSLAEVLVGKLCGQTLHKLGGGQEEESAMTMEAPPWVAVVLVAVAVLLRERLVRAWRVAWRGPRPADAALDGRRLGSCARVAARQGRTELLGGGCADQ